MTSNVNPILKIRHAALSLGASFFANSLIAALACAWNGVSFEPVFFIPITICLVKIVLPFWAVFQLPHKFGVSLLICALAYLGLQVLGNLFAVAFVVYRHLFLRTISSDIMLLSGLQFCVVYVFVLRSTVRFLVGRNIGSTYEGYRQSR